MDAARVERPGPCCRRGGRYTKRGPLRGVLRRGPGLVLELATEAGGQHAHLRQGVDQRSGIVSQWPRVTPPACQPRVHEQLNTTEEVLLRTVRLPPEGGCGDQGAEISLKVLESASQQVRQVCPGETENRPLATTTPPRPGAFTRMRAASPGVRQRRREELGPRGVTAR